MSSNPQQQSDAAIVVSGVSKCFHIYGKPQDRLKQSIMPRLRRGLGLRQKAYSREFWALKNVSFTLNKGETLGIIGRNGSGKSTLLQLICGTLSPTHGHVQTFGRVAALLELGAGFNPEFTGRENVYLSAAFYGLTKEQTDERFDDIVNFSEIRDFIDQPVKTYSSGMFVRLAFATIAHVDADILIIDEALAVGDAIFTQKCMRFLRKFKEEKTLLFVSHDSTSVIALCDKALWLADGETRELGEAKQTSEHYLNFILGATQDKQLQDQTHASATARKLREIWAGGQPYETAGPLSLFQPNLQASAQTDPLGAQINYVNVTAEDGSDIRALKGGEVVTLTIRAVAYTELRSPVLGFYIKDRLGQFLFGSNTLSIKDRLPPVAAPGQEFKAEFTFPMPWLAGGDYSIQVAVADGTQQDHTSHHWIHDAVIFHSSQDPSASGLIGIPMLDIQLSIDTETGL
ncbi:MULTISPECIES: ABC transporter ATP-binding protein [Pseudomonas]|uniref:ABC transporter ATP-binding protein n=1 Tax=Pseudomonas monteilii TaxID=76759 RepID=A0A7X3JS13_9PSED|nr:MULTISPECIES: ABC transporter ATP-binding protein [Pseudomonas]MBA6137462.1 ABC transporter ATP-binding protein [Pseudomonas monteilii]MBI6918992.1 ABC transporter ATP-binding protein [Pseudomonas monteilii]MCA4076714.1 ABC transporter ATP-binding protein [Pseudomonas kurunegalensis]MCE0937118.1 ABC transporter ATP-binding protein [Pseudomonas kurunegalensis]MDT3745659.1 ABC transporter ATP-binding protein [Pseudomonas kurunegalensis]